MSEQPINDGQTEVTAPGALAAPGEYPRIGEHAAFRDVIVATMASLPPTPDEQQQLHYDQHSLRESERLLYKAGISLPPLAAPPAYDLQKFSPEDWQAVRDAPEPFLKLWSIRYTHEVQTHYEMHGQSTHHTLRTPERIQHELALVRSLPVIQRTSLRALEAAVTDGVFRSNRAVRGDKPGISTGAGNTLGDDQVLGLDNYVYADYGRPSSIRFDSEVAVVFEPEVMQVPGTFLTEKDIRNYDIFDPTTKDVDYRKYMAGAVLAEDFQQTVIPKILANRSLRTLYAGKGLGNSHYPMELEDFVAGSDSNPDNLGNPHFSTWEVKIPGEVPTTAIRKLIFTTEEGRQNFVAKFGDTVPCAVATPEDLAPNPKPGDKQVVAARYRRNLELFGTNERYTQELATLRDEDYTRRQTAVATAEESSDGYMLIHHPAPDALDAIKYDPKWYAVSPKVFVSKEDALLMARRDYDPGGEHAEKAALGEEVQVIRNGVLQWEKARRREIEIHTPTVTVVHIKHSPGAAVITDLAVENISNT